MEVAIIIFLLLFAVLAFGWFYLQRAKDRTAPADDAAPAVATAAPAAPAAPAEPAPAAEVDTTRTDQTAS